MHCFCIKTVYFKNEGSIAPEGLRAIDGLGDIDPKTATTEEILNAMKAIKPKCTGYDAPYDCENHTTVPVATAGELIDIQTGDELSLSGMKFQIVDFTGSATGGYSGRALIKFPYLNHNKIGVAFTGIKVREGGCVVEGRAAVSDVDVSVLSAEMRAKVDVAYAAYKATLAVVKENSGTVAQTFNNVADLLKAVRGKAQAVIDKMAAGNKPDKTELNTLEKLANEGIKAKKKELDILNKQPGADTSSYILKLNSWIAKQEAGVVCVNSYKSTATETPKKGPAEYYIFDCDMSGLVEVEPNNSFEIEKIEILNSKILSTGVSVSDYIFIGKKNFSIGILPSGICEPYTNTPNFSFCCNDKPKIIEAKKMNLIDEVGVENLSSLLNFNEITHWNKFSMPFKLYGINEITENFKSGKSKQLELSQDVYKKNLKESSNFLTFEKRIIHELFDEIKNNNFVELNESFLLDKLSPPNLSEKVWKFVPSSIYLAMGGTQKVEIDISVWVLKNINNDNKTNLNNYAFSINYTIWDSFGLDWDDINSGAKGEDLKFAPLRSAFVLQHYYGYHPFFTFVKHQHTFKLIK